MKKWVILYCFTFSFQLLKAHPGIGIVADSKGNIYYTDLKHIWKITPDGNRSIAVNDVHSHELYMDSSDNLFGEHLWYNGEKLDTWGHYVWCLKSDGKLVKVKEPSAGFLQEYSFVRDREGNMYWLEHWKESRFKKRTLSGEIITLAEGKFNSVSWIFANSDGSVYFINQNDLYKIDKSGNVGLVANTIDKRIPTTTDSLFNRHFFGIWSDSAGNIFVAIKGEDIVKKITPGGIVSSVIHSSSGWFPTGGVFDRESNLWLMECNMMNQTRVSKISSRKLSTSPLPIKSSNFPWAIFGAFVVSTSMFVIIKKYFRKKHLDV